MGVDYNGEFGVGVQIMKPDFDSDTLKNTGIDDMYEYMEYILSICGDVHQFKTGSEYNNSSDKIYLCLNNPFVDGVYQQEKSNELLELLDLHGIKYIGKIDCVGGLYIW